MCHSRAVVTVSAALLLCASVAAADVMGERLAWFRSEPLAADGYVVWTNIDTWWLASLDLSTGTERNLAGGGYAARTGGKYVVWSKNEGAPGGPQDVRGYDLQAGVGFPIAVEPGVIEGGPDVGGSLCVYVREYDIHSLDLLTGASRVICDQANGQSMPATDGRTVVWEETRNFATSNQDIYAYDMVTHTERTVCTVPLNQFRPDVCGRYVVWEDYRNGSTRDIWGYDLLTGTEFPICRAAGEQERPRISGNWVVWQDARAGSANSRVYGYDLALGVEFPIATTAGGHYVPDVYGNHVVWQVGPGYPAPAAYSAWLAEHVLLMQFEPGQTPAGLGLAVTAGAGGGAEVCNVSGNTMLRLFDTAGDPVSVTAACRARDYVTIEFDYRFATDGKLEILLGGHLVDTVLAPAGGPGRDSLAAYDERFDLAAFGLAEGDCPLTFRLSNQGDPEFFMDGLMVSSPLPEPATLALVALGALGVLRRRKA